MRFKKGDWIWLEDAQTFKLSGESIPATRCSVRVTAVKGNSIMGFMPLMQGTEPRSVDVGDSRNTIRRPTELDTSRIRAHVSVCPDWSDAPWGPKKPAVPQFGVGMWVAGKKTGLLMLVLKCHKRSLRVAYETGDNIGIAKDLISQAAVRPATEVEAVDANAHLRSNPALKDDKETLKVFNGADPFTRAPCYIVSQEEWKEWQEWKKGPTATAAVFDRQHERIQELEKACAEAEEDIHQLEGKYEDTNMAWEGRGDIITRLEKEKAALEAELDVSETNWGASHQRVNDLMAKNTQLTNDLTEARAQARRDGDESTRQGLLCAKLKEKLQETLESLAIAKTHNEELDRQLALVDTATRFRPESMELAGQIDGLLDRRDKIKEIFQGMGVAL